MVIEANPPEATIECGNCGVMLIGAELCEACGVEFCEQCIHEHNCEEN